MRRTWTTRFVILTAVLLVSAAGLFAALQNPRATGTPLVLPGHTAPVRLVQVFEEAHWIELPPIVPPPERLLHDGFEPEDLAAWQSAEPQALQRVREGVDGTWALVLDAGDEPRELPEVRRRIEVSPGQRYRIAVQVRTEGLGSAATGSEGATLSVTRFSADGVDVTEDVGPRLRGDTPWRTLETLVTAEPDTVAFELRLSPGTGQTLGRVLFDDLTVDRLDPRAGLPLMRSWTEHARPAPSIDIKTAALGRETRPAIAHHAPASWGFQVDVPDDGATLRFGWGLGEGTDEAARVCLRVDWADQRLGGTLFDECLAGDEGRAWADTALALDRDGPLRFSATTATPDKITEVFWSDVRVDVAPSEARPSVALLVIDTLRADHLGSYGHSDRPSSPTLDALAAAGVRFETARAPSGWTAPSMGTLVTGRLAAEHRAGTRVVREQALTREALGARRKNLLAYTGMTLEHPTLGELLAGAGYETFGIQSNYFFSPPMGFARGYGRNQNYKGSSLKGARKAVKEVQRWLGDRDEDRPFLLRAHFIDPHMPYRMRRPWAPGFTPPEALPGLDHDPELPALVLRDLPAKEQAHADAAQVLYDADIRWVDDALGELIPLLEAQDALIIVVSDHGEAFLEHGVFSHGHGLYEELLRVPLLVRLPGGALAGTVVDRPVTLLDVVPTILGQVGVEPPTDLPGVDLFAADLPPPEPFITESMYSGPDRTGVVDGDVKYVYTHPPGFLGFNQARVEPSARAYRAVEELYDLAADPGEQHNLARERPDQVAHYRAQVHAWLASTWPGLHIRCDGTTDEQVLTASESIGQISPFTVEPSDRIALDRTRHQVTLGLTGDSDWLAVRLLEPRATATLGDKTWSLGTGELPAEPPEPGPGCQVWEVLHSGAAAQDVDSETFAELEALGYVE